VRWQKALISQQFSLEKSSAPQYRLRVDGIRVFYDITGNDVVVLAIMSKEKTDEWLKEHGEK
jgi:mRNA interferase RelE/StbE